MLDIKEQYDMLLESGDLEMLFPKASKDWDTDKKRFTVIYNANQEMLKKYDRQTGKENLTDLV